MTAVRTMSSHTLTSGVFGAALVGALAIGVAAFPATARAQGGGSRFEIHSIGGFFIPTGDQRDELKDGMMLGLGAGYQILPNLTVVGSFAWTGSQAKELTGEPDVNIYHYDIGAQYRVADFELGTSWRLRSFLGAGLGGRTYDTKGSDTDAQTNFTGYGSLGMEALHGRMGFRLEARDYVSGYSGLTGTRESTTRNDVGIFSGMTFHF